VQNRYPLRLTCIEKANTFEIDKIQFPQIQNDWRFAALDFGFDLIQVPKSKFAAEPNPPLDLFNPQRHFLLAPEDNDRHCRSQAVCNSLLQLDLDWRVVLIFQEFLFDQEQRQAYNRPRCLLGHASDRKRHSAERWTN
jgi:hypothetical protein